MCLTGGENAGKRYKIFEKIDSIFQSDGIPWQSCASLSVDNTNAMKGNAILLVPGFQRKILMF